jgi:hypothetical protein
MVPVAIHRSGNAKSEDPGSDDVVTFVAPARLRRVGREMRMLIENPAGRLARHSTCSPQGAVWLPLRLVDQLK